MIKKHTNSPITFCSWYQCDRLDEISSGMEDLVKYGETISKGEEFNIYKAFGYELLGSNVTEGEAYLAGKRRHEEILKQKEEEKRRAERERWESIMESGTIYNPWMGERKKSKPETKPENNRSLILVCFLCLLLPATVVLFYIFDNASEICNLICNNIFLIALFLIPSTIIFVGHKIETRKRNRTHL